MTMSGEGFRRSVDEALDALLEWRAGDDSPSVGEAAAGMVRAEATPGGRIASLVIAAEAWAQPREQLVNAVVAAVNTALEQREQRWAGAVGVDDPDGVVRRLEQVQVDATARMDEFLRALSESHSRINQRLEE